jgi:hypothetical protein
VIDLGWLSLFLVIGNRSSVLGYILMGLEGGLECAVLNNLVDCCPCHRSLLSHHLRPYCRLIHRIIHRLPSAQGHRRHRRRCCNPLFTPTAAHRPLSSSRCLPTAAIVAATPSLLQPLSLRLPPPALDTPSDCQRNDVSPAVVP